ncbi:MAG TPA: lipid-A-disaccharide synthase [Gammaproteobacteria bacterium]|nr:lipid-A-disaccharide synthase [Gammaproteobacteria bacterium]
MPSERPLRIALAAGEASGDALGGGLMAALRERAPGSRYFGIAGPTMSAAGCETWHHTEELSVMGFAEVLRHLPRLLELRRGLIRRLIDAAPDVFIGIDSPDFNLPVARALRRTGIATVQYVSPQVWAWRQSRVVSIREAVDLVLCLLPFEAAFYERHGVKATFVGHPLADEIPLEVDRGAARAALGLAADGPLLAVLPGSRRTEVARLARPFMETARWLRGRHADLGVVVALASDTTHTEFVERTRGIELEPRAQVVVRKARQALAAADVVLTASGTATLEATLLKRPMVVAYIISGLTHGLYRLLGLRKLPYFSLPNLLAGRELFPEYLQREVRAETLGPALELQLARSADRSGWYDAVTAIHGELRRGASEAAAAAVLALLDRKAR